MYSTKDEKMLMTEMWDPQIADDPEAFVLFAFPWGAENTPLHDKKGPKTWQREELQAIAQAIKDNRQRVALGLTPKVEQFAICSGRGPGKSTLSSWLTLWMMSCQIGSSTVIAANSESQLKLTTWAELGKWHTLAINSHWFDKQALSLKPQEWFSKALKDRLKIDSTYYYALAKLWAEETPETFAGIHNPLGVLLIFDEASGIPEPIWKVSEGYFTEPVVHRYWGVFSNPRRNKGAFYECFNAQAEFWRTRNIDARDVEGADVNWLNGIIRKYGEDSDEARIEVKGQFPRQGDDQFISREIVEAARDREILDDEFAPLIMGVDPARFGNDSTVIRFRQGRNGRIIPPIKLKGFDNMAVANTCADLILKYNPDAVCVDAGNGTGIIDRLRELKFKVHEVWFGARTENREFADKRTELWGEMRDWLKGACIDNDQALKNDLVNPGYKFTKDERIRLESKDELRRKGMASPDDADALACTFAVKPSRRDLRTSRHSSNRNQMAVGIDYDIL